MSDIKIKCGEDVTSVFVRPGALKRIGELFGKLGEAEPVSRALLVTDDCVDGLYGTDARGALGGLVDEVDSFTFPHGDGSKSLAVLRQAYDLLADRRFDRGSVVVALGGGVVSDLAGFVAATWMRGIRWGVVATTLESAIDACIGGKTAINLPAGKNLVGAFHQPSVVVVDPVCLASLPDRDMRAGLAEALKHALLASPALLEWQVENLERILARDPGALAHLITENLRIKADVVASDVRERAGHRVFLNFGHTVGHAIESCMSYMLRHGECVGLGVLAACRLSADLNLLDERVVDRVREELVRMGLPTNMPEPIEADRILAGIAHDKKSQAGRHRFVLLEEIGRPVVVDDVAESAIRRAYASLLP